MLSSPRPKAGKKRTIAAAALSLTLVGSGAAALVGSAAADPSDRGAQQSKKSQQARGDASRRQAKLSKKLRNRVNARAIGRRMDALQRAADNNDGNRASGTPGYDASRDYVVSTLRRAGYRPRVQEFTFPYFEESAASVLAETAPGSTTYTNPDDYVTMEYSGSGDVTSAAVVPVDTDGSAAPSTTSGCETEDFAGFPAGAIALVQRGSCSFGQKATNAEAAGAAAVVIFNYGVEGLEGPINGTLGGPGSGIPALGASYATGAALYEAEEARVFTETTSETRTTYNVIAQTRRGNKGQVVMAGAHLDSVPEGPGINDNGSGSATLLETAVQLKKFDKKKRGKSKRPRIKNGVRFAWWGAEESGLLGSEHYVDELSVGEAEDIALYLNFDMVGSPNYARFVYDGDNSTGQGAEGPSGSDHIEQVFADYFASQGLASDPTPFNGRSDYGPFIADGVGIPAGGLFTGAEGIKTEVQARRYGGEAGVAYDPCYHQACDTRGNVNRKAIDEMSDAVAHAVAYYAVRRDLFGGDTYPGPGARAAAPRGNARGKAQGKVARDRAGLHPQHDGARR